ncbi:MAG TPA: hypothetical protein VFF11_10305, partial [Candidatus Binatia bacterium]|nr:hypothetical protein [Candidatus Binatia bacterium]
MQKARNSRYLKNVLTTVLFAAVLPGYGAILSDLVCSYAPSTASAWGGEANARLTMANEVIGSNALNDQTGTGAGFNIVGYFMSSRDSVGEDNGTVVGLVANDASYSDVR